MVNITGEETSERSATAKTMILMQPRTKPLIKESGLKKGDVVGVARLAGIMAAKRTADLISLCRPLMLTALTDGFTCEYAVPGDEDGTDEAVFHSFRTCFHLFLQRFVAAAAAAIALDETQELN